MPEQDRDDAGPRRPGPVPESVEQRILCARERESEGVFGSTLGRVARHFAAAEADPPTRPSSGAAASAAPSRSSA